MSYAVYELDCVSEPSTHCSETECTATKLLETNHTAEEIPVNSANSTFIRMLSTIVTMENFPEYCEYMQYGTLYKAITPVLVLSI
jgi:vacuolar-type H+-ATPase subunit I/STV1